MSILKKLGAVGLGTASVAGALVTMAAKEALKKAGNAAGSNGVTDSQGRTYYKKDYDNLSNKCNDDIFKKGLKTAVKLWKEE